MAPTRAYESSFVEGPVWRFHSGENLASRDIAPEVTFGPGQTVAQVLGGYGLEAWESQALIEELARHTDLRRLRPEDRYATLLGSDRAARGASSLSSRAREGR